MTVLASVLAPVSLGGLALIGLGVVTGTPRAVALFALAGFLWLFVVVMCRLSAFLHRQKVSGPPPSAAALLRNSRPGRASPT